MITLSITSGAGAPGDFLSLDVSIASTGGDECVAIQFEVLHSAELMLLSAVAGPVVAAASKTMNQVGNVFVISTPPLNVNVIGDGVLVTLNFQIDPIAPHATYPCTPSDVISVDVDAEQLTSARVAGVVVVGGGGSPTLTIACPVANTAMVGVPYIGGFAVSGGTPPYTVSLPSGSLPPGLTLSASTGLFSGTPTSPGLYPFSGRVRDSVGAVATT